MSRPYDIVTFDCYGTLIDWDAGIGGWFETTARENGLPFDRAQVLSLYAETEPAVEAEAFRGYREVLAETALRVAGRLHWPLSPQKSRGLANSLPDWRPFPDTNPALRELAAAGYRLGILSNVDDDLLDGTRRLFSVPFDVIVTAAQVRSYKPAPGHFEEARRRIGGLRWLHAAQSHFHDVVPCLAAGVPVAWVNRKAEPGDPRTRPDIEVANLAELARRLT